MKVTYNTFGRMLKLIHPGEDTTHPTLTGGYISPNLRVPATLTSYDGLGRMAQGTAS